MSKKRSELGTPTLQNKDTVQYDTFMLTSGIRKNTRKYGAKILKNTFLL